MTVMLLTHDNLGTITAPRYSPTELLPCQLLLVCVGNIPKHSNLNPSTPKWLNPKLLFSDHLLNLSGSRYLCVQ